MEISPLIKELSKILGDFSKLQSQYGLSHFINDSSAETTNLICTMCVDGLVFNFKTQKEDIIKNIIENQNKLQQSRANQANVMEYDQRLGYNFADNRLLGDFYAAMHEKVLKGDPAAIFYVLRFNSLFDIDTNTQYHKKDLELAKQNNTSNVFFWNAIYKASPSDKTAFMVLLTVLNYDKDPIRNKDRYGRLASMSFNANQLDIIQYRNEIISIINGPGENTQIALPNTPIYHLDEIIEDLTGFLRGDYDDYAFEKSQNIETSKSRLATWILANFASFLAHNIDKESKDPLGEAIGWVLSKTCFKPATALTLYSYAMKYVVIAEPGKEHFKYKICRGIKFIAENFNDNAQPKLLNLLLRKIDPKNWPLLQVYSKYYNDELFRNIPNLDIDVPENSVIHNLILNETHTLQDMRLNQLIIFFAEK